MAQRLSKSASKPYIITIGRTPTNSIVLDQSNVSSQHARITISGEEMLLEDLGSTNGTAIGKIENKISRGKIQPTDTIFLGSTPYQVSDLLGMVESTNSPSPMKTGSNDASSRQLKKYVVPVATVAFLALSVLIYSMIVSNRRGIVNDAEEQKAIVAPEAIDQNSSLPTSESPALSSQEQLEKSLFVVVVSNPDEEIAFRVGNCFAIDDKHLATTASIVTSMRRFQQDGYTEVFLFNPTNSTRLDLKSAKIHPLYEQASAKARVAQEAYDEIYERSRENLPRPDQIEEVEKELIANKITALKAMEIQATYDAAVLTTTSTLESWIPSEKQSSQFRPNLKLTIKALAFDIQDPYFDAQEVLEVSSLESRFQELRKFSKKDPPRILASVPPEHTQFTFIGSPVLLSNGTVVALYSRPTPPLDGESQTEPATTYDGPLYDRIRECLER